MPHIAKIITPVFDLSAISNPVLSFWYTTNDRGSLDIYYKNSPDGKWNMFKYFNNTPDWQEAVLLLPNRSNHYQIAFVHFYSGGGGLHELQFDDISITDDKVAVSSYYLDNLLLFPNPVSDFLTIERSGATKEWVTIYDSKGALAHSFETTEIKIDINVSNYISGIYFISFSGGNGSTTKSFIKK